MFQVYNGVWQGGKDSWKRDSAKPELTAPFHSPIWYRNMFIVKNADQLVEHFGENLSDETWQEVRKEHLRRAVLEVSGPRFPGCCQHFFLLGCDRRVKFFDRKEIFLIYIVFQWFVKWTRFYLSSWVTPRLIIDPPIIEKGGSRGTVSISIMGGGTQNESLVKGI